ncbi:MAG: hypothetical protein LBK63_14025 [Treponema sp.]|jgi:hypothetical protein|nr:hypothetical protein [Treponema sp.]
MAAPRPKSSLRLFAAVLNFAVSILFAGCWLDEGTIAYDYIYNEVSIQATVKNDTSRAMSVTLLPALGTRKKTAYQWAVGRGEIGLEPDSFPTETTDLAVNSKQVLKTRLGQRAYRGFQPGDEILSFLLRIDKHEYAGWDTAAYGNGGRTFDQEEHGYAVLGEDSNIKWNSSLPPGKQYIDPNGFPSEWVTVRYSITITNSGVEFVLDEIVYGLREEPLCSQD